MNAISTEQFRQALGNFATGVTIITARDASNDPIGITVNSFASLSLEPPLILWGIDFAAEEFDAFISASHFAVHILQHDQQQLADKFSDCEASKFANLTVENGLADLPLLSECPVLLQCEVANRHEEGDHTIVIGKVMGVSIRSTNPLVFFNGRYTGLRN